MGCALRRISVLTLLVLVPLFVCAPVSAHDPSSYGGVFRSRDLGHTWLNADAGLFLNAALTVAVDPRNPSHLLLGTELGLLSSSTGGRSWAPEAQGLIVGAVFAAAIAPDGNSAICASPGGVFRFDGQHWERVAAPDDAAPARAVLFSRVQGRVYLLGRDRLFTSDDGGRHFAPAGAALPEGAPISALAVAGGAQEMLFAIMNGRLAASEDGGAVWIDRLPGLGVPLDAVNADSAEPNRVWAAGADQLYRSDDRGRSWRSVGRPLPERGTRISGIAADATATVLLAATHRGLYRSDEGGQNWTLVEGILPAHLEAGPLTRDPASPRTLYAVYSLLPYPDVWRTALEGGNLLARTDPVSLAGGGAFLLLLLIGGTLLVGRLARSRGMAPPSARKLPS